jgi:hypothetical protein
MISHFDLEAAKARLRVPEVWRILQLPGAPGALCRSPFREDRNPSFSVFKDGLRWNDFATGEHGDAIEFLRKARGLTNGEAVRQFLELANGRCLDPVPIIRAEKAIRETQKPDLSGLREGSRAEFNALAGSRNISLKAVEIAHDMELLRFGSVKGYSSWIATDCSGWCAEARRLDRKPFPACRSAQRELPERKAHTIYGSKKTWPVGIEPQSEYRHAFDTIALVEGGPDLLAVIHFALKQNRLGILPVAILGRSAGSQGLHPAALEKFRGFRVRIFPHNDSDGLGIAHSLRWAKQLEQLGCKVDFFIFNGLQKGNGAPAKDLNDCVELATDFLPRLEEMFP